MSCGGCPLRGACGKTRCPRCGYEAVRTPGWLRRLFRDKGAVPEQDPPGSLAGLRPGQCGTVTGFPGADRRTLRKLLALGLTPGARFGVVRARPGVVLRLGHAEVALDRETARRVAVTADARGKGNPV